jgi:hypothetical protein
MTDEGNRKREESLRVFSQAATIYDRIGREFFLTSVNGSWMLPKSLLVPMCLT